MYARVYWICLCINTCDMTHPCTRLYIYIYNTIYIPAYGWVISHIHTYTRTVYTYMCTHIRDMAHSYAWPYTYVFYNIQHNMHRHTHYSATLVHSFFREYTRWHSSFTIYTVTIITLWHYAQWHSIRNIHIYIHTYLFYHTHLYEWVMPHIYVYIYTYWLYIYVFTYTHIYVTWPIHMRDYIRMSFTIYIDTYEWVMSYTYIYIHYIYVYTYWLHISACIYM